mgnify:CR=1 FL=1
MSKWLPDVSPTDRAVEVAARSIAVRLDQVRRYLKRSVKRPGVAENVHQLRVWTRRADAALSLYEDLLPPKRLTRMRRMLKRARRVSGRIRDCDVYAERAYGVNSHWPISLRVERMKAQRKLVALFENLDCGRELKKQAGRLISRMLDRNKLSRETYLKRANSAMRPLITAFFEASPSEASGDEQLHQFRITGKALRYAMELLSGAFPASFRDELYPEFATLQEKLGTINDLAVGQNRLRKQMEQTLDPVVWSELGGQSAEATAELERARQDFRSWWTPHVAQELRRSFEEFLVPVRT